MKHQLKKNFYKALTYLPQKTQNEIWRAKINIPSQFSKKLCVKIAENHQELEESFRLVYENYLQMGYCAKNPHKMRATIYHALPTTTTLIAKYNGKIIGTLTIVRDNRLGLPSESIFNYKPLRIHSNRLAEITSLTIDKEFRRKRGGEVFFPLLKFMYDYCTYYFGVNHLLVTIAPKEIPFYKSILLFKQHQDSKIKDYLGAPAISLQLDLQQALYDYESIYKDKAKNKNLFKFFVEDQLEQLKFPIRTYNYINDPLVDLNYYNELFVNKLKLSLDIKERRKIESIIKQNHTNRSNPRVDVDAGAKAKLKGSSLKQKEIDFNIKDVSRNGFRAFTSEAFPLSSNLLFNIKLADTITAKVQAKAVWVSADFGVGFEILNADKEWNRFIDFLYRNQLKKVG